MFSECIYTTPSPRAGYLKSEFFFSWTGYHTKTKEPNLFYLFIVGGDSYISYGYQFYVTYKYFCQGFEIWLTNLFSTMINVTLSISVCPGFCYVIASPSTHDCNECGDICRDVMDRWQVKVHHPFDLEKRHEFIFNYGEIIRPNWIFSHGTAPNLGEGKLWIPTSFIRHENRYRW